MTTTATASLHTSELGFFDRWGNSLEGPTEWRPLWMVVPCPLDEIEDLTVLVNGRTAPCAIRFLDGALRVIADWDRAGPGWYNITVDIAGMATSHRVRIEPAKISREAFAHMLTDLESRLPVTLAIALRDLGAKVGVHFEPPKEQTLATEVARLRRAVHGDGRPGLATVLAALADDPHRMLVNVGTWVKRQHVRRPDPGALVQALWRADNIEDGQLKRVVDRRVEHTVDLYENRILRAFTDEAERRLRLMAGLLEESTHGHLLEEVAAMLRLMVQARRKADFLNDVGRLRTAPTRVSMVLLKRKEYRAAYEGFWEFRRRLGVHLDDPALSEPLRNLPYLYQVWGTLIVMEATLRAAEDRGFRVVEERMVWPQHGGLYLKVLRDNKPAITLRGDDGRSLRVYPERSYSKASTPLRSVSFTQRPDIALELTTPAGDREVFIFDPKYKLASEESEDATDGKPKKEDVDKMHAYRDAIRDQSVARVVRYAATLYPGTNVTYGHDVAALRMYPGEEAQLRVRVQAILARWLGHG